MPARVMVTDLCSSSKLTDDRGCVPHPSVSISLAGEGHFILLIVKRFQKPSVVAGRSIDEPRGWSWQFILRVVK
ncbi:MULTISPECIES: hypothetical protein [Parafrankia]|uniref:hypothetical protein n=1 Tax=Parafrankia TaxID=2994362 RepID=UPI000DA4AB4E|nr:MULTISPECIES: hypothetical protein [Parafrankia]SQD99261.1 hypothetical protein FMEAI12_5170010 [Parafrankia sp. Ea1.12]